MRPHTTQPATDDRDAPREQSVPSSAAPGEAATTGVRPKRDASDPGVPRPLSPLDGALVDASAAPFSWRGVPGATGYKLQIATEPGFGGDVITLDVGRTNALTVYGMLPVSDQPLFWRVRASSKPEAWSGYGRFVAASDDAVDAYRQEQDVAAAEAAREAVRQRVAREAELDLVPYYERETSMTSVGEASILLWMLASFAVFLLLLVLVV